MCSRFDAKKAADFRTVNIVSNRDEDKKRKHEKCPPVREIKSLKSEEERKVGAQSDNKQFKPFSPGHSSFSPLRDMIGLLCLTVIAMGIPFLLFRCAFHLSFADMLHSTVLMPDLFGPSRNSTAFFFVFWCLCWLPYWLLLLSWIADLYRPRLTVFGAVCLIMVAIPFFMPLIWFLQEGFSFKWFGTSLLCELLFLEEAVVFSRLAGLF